MAPFHDGLFLREATSGSDLIPQKDLQKWTAAGTVLAIFTAFLIGIIIALARSNAAKSKDIRLLHIDIRRLNGEEEDITGEGGVVLRRYEARSLPALKARLEATQRENADLKQQLNTVSESLERATKEFVATRFRKSVDFNSVQDPSSWIGQAITSPPMSPRTRPIDIPSRRSDKGKENEDPIMSIRRKSVPGQFVRNGNVRMHAVEVHGQHENTARSVSGSIGMIDNPFSDDDTLFSPNSPRQSALRDRRDALQLIREDPDDTQSQDGRRSPFTSQPFKPTPFLSVAQRLDGGGSSVTRNVGQRQSYHGSRSRREATVTSPGATSLPAGSPRAADFEDISLVN